MARYVKSGTVNTVQEINSELEKIATAQDEFLTRNGEAPNEMKATLDMNSHRITNLPIPVSGSDAVRLQDLGSGEVALLEGTTRDLILSTQDFTILTVVKTGGYLLSGDSGGGYWVKTGVTGLTPSQTPEQLGDALLNDALGNQWKLVGRVIAVDKLGADPTGTKDSSLAFQAAANTNLPITLGVGNYTCSTAINFTGAPRIEGEGIAYSKVYFAGTDGFVIAGTVNNFDPVDLSEFSLLTSTEGVGEANLINNTSQTGSGVIQNRTSVRVIIKNIAVLGSGSVDTTGWKIGIRGTSILHATIDGFHFTGLRNLDSGSILNSFVGILLDGTGSPVEVTLQNSWVFHSRVAVQTENCEGIFISKCNFINVNVGVLFNAPNKKPQLNLINSHINANVVCVDLINLAQGIIANNLFYARPSAPASVFGVRLTSSIFTQIVNNTFVDASPFNLDSVLFVSEGNGCLVKDNIFQSSETAIWLEEVSSGVRVGRNVYGTVVKKVLDQSSLSYVEGAFTTAKRTATYSLADGITLSAIPWTASEQSSAASWSITNPTRLTARVTGRYKISANLVFDLSVVGARRASIRKNGIPVLGFPSTSVTPIAGATTTISLGEVTVSLVAGDYIELFAAQTSGAPMTLPIAESSLKLEFVDEN